MSINTTDRIPWILIRNAIVSIAFLILGYKLYTASPPNEVAAGLCVTNALGLLVHSGRSRRSRYTLEDVDNAMRKGDPK